ncbi:MAG: DNA-directed RNA polymerase subunit alpha, partial [Candidatus Latescibacteria bacterium]|nr:DNA-directed RNA polymerase subunit alpha [Candidatus Latescibacterota bacterium]
MDNEQKEYRTTFKLAPLPERMGTTIGNAVRRTLVSSIEGTAVTAVWIEGAAHECAVLPGVKEDVVDMVARLRQLRVKLLLGDSATLTLRADSEGEITAGDIAPQYGVEILNPDLPIATLDQ